ncbi:MAG: SLC13 family permease, partial [Acidobacteria bacterium]|nr:SLC13 family permease [Acidobacteriota bacterium]
MTASIAFLLIVLAAMIVLFLTEKLPIDLTAFLGLIILVFTGYVTSDQAFTGFASSAVITMLSIFIVSGALMNAGVADFAAVWIHKIVGSRELPLLITIMITAGVLSAFMNNIAATAVLMPAVASLSKKAGIQPSKIFIPLSFGAILGGTTTLVRTPPNILAGSILSDRGLKPFELFDFTILGVIVLSLGVIYMITVGRKLLPDRRMPEDDAGRELAELYRLEESSFTIRIPAGSSIEGKTLAETGIGNTLGVQIIAVLRGGHRILAPPAETDLRANDELLVCGSRERLSEILGIKGVDIEETVGEQITLPQRGVSGVKLRLNKGSQLAGKSLFDHDFRKRFGVAVMAVDRRGERFTKKVGHIKLEEGDFLFGIGASEKIANLADQTNLFEIEIQGIAALTELKDEPVLVLRLPEDSS